MMMLSHLCTCHSHLHKGGGAGAVKWPATARRERKWCWWDCGHGPGQQRRWSWLRPEAKDL